MSAGQLLDRIRELEIFNAQLLEEKEREVGLDFAWTGNLGHWYWNVATNRVTFNSLKIRALGYTPEELPEQVPFQFFTDKLHPDDLEPTMNAMRAHLHGTAHVYEAEYRIQSKDGSWRWFYDRGRITVRGEKGAPVFLAGIVFDVTDRKKHEAELETSCQVLSEEAVTDGLTRLRNHRATVEKLQAEAAHSRKSRCPVSLILFDIDFFKKVNDTYGHLAGDNVLAGVASIIQRNARTSDLAGRYGGEEFVLILPGVREREARTIAERIRSEVEQAAFSDGIKVTVSAGVRGYRGETPVEFFDAVDKNMYEAKRTGRNKVV